MLKKFLLFLIVFFAGCAAPAVTWITYVPKIESPRNDLIHTVGLSEGLWQIAKAYDVGVQTIVDANNFSVPVVLSVGQQVQVPNAARIRPVIPLYPSTKWKYIIIHHSATDSDNAVMINTYHSSKGFENGVGYQFVIDNGSYGRYDGEIEVSPRWLKQLNGAHCKADGMNEKGIGICLIGDFNSDRVSRKQMDALIYLVKHLMRYYHIPKEHILGHGQVSGAKTDCPGKRFPWKIFFNFLKK